MSYRVATASILSGLIFSILLATAGPHLVPLPRTLAHANLGQWRATSWLATEYYSSAPRDVHPTAAAIVRLVTNAAYIEPGYPPPSQPSPDARYWNLLQTGFPFRSFQGWELRLMQSAPSLPPEYGPTRGGFMTIARRDPDAPTWRTWLVYSPIWPGLLANALAWSAGVWLALSAPIAFCRLSRRRRGLCLRCGYDLRNTPPPAPCPECGATRR